MVKISGNLSNHMLHSRFLWLIGDEQSITPLKIFSGSNLENIKRVFIKTQHDPENTVCVLFLQSCLTLCDPVDCSPPGSSVHGILQARILE